MRLPPELREWTRLLAKRGIMGSTENEVVANMVRYALNDMTQNGYVQKFIEQRKLLKGEK